ncbi:hypothetical protein PCO82_02580 [Pectobacteriaceae bacterium CE90]|nr:hypothetical protein PCO82_02580 [Pectobacteriaceae bacterium CE90]
MCRHARIFLYKKKSLRVKGSFLVLNIIFSYFVSPQSGLLYILQHFLPQIHCQAAGRVGDWAIVCIAACVIFVMFAGMFAKRHI